MYPARFEYRAPATLEEAIALLADGGEDARVIAGGQSLIPMMKLRFAAPSLLVDLNTIPGLEYAEERNGHLCVGPLARNSQLAVSDVLESRYPTMAAVAPRISDPLVRNLGTLGGSLAHADPAGDWGSVMLALDAEVQIRSASGERVVAIDDFLVDTFTTALEAGEVLTEVRVPKPEGRFGGAYLEIKRKVGDFATAGAAVSLELDDGHVRRAGIAMTAVGPRNLKAAAAEEALTGSEASDVAFDEAARLAAEAAEPVSDVRGSAEYKREAVRVFVRRGLERARDMATAV